MPGTKKSPLQPPSNDLMRHAAEEILSGCCHSTDRMNYLLAVTGHIAREMVLPEEDPHQLSAKLFAVAALADRDSGSSKPIKNRQALTPKAVKGEAFPLTPTQRELISIFVGYLRTLPEYKEGQSWESGEYKALNRLLSRFFEERNPTWVARADGSLYIHDLPEAEREAYNRLMENAGTPADPRSAAIKKRRMALIKLAQDKQWLVKLAERYENDRVSLGLKPDFTIQRAAATPLEHKAENTWGEK